MRAVVTRGSGTDDVLRLFRRIGFTPSILGCDIAELDYKPDLLVLTGGIDIDPSCYGKGPQPATMSPNAPTLRNSSLVYPYNKRRDMFEIRNLRYARDNNIPVFGICRGHQLMCVVDGGELVTHASHQPHRHHILTSEGEFVLVNSFHHQTIIPRPGVEVLACEVVENGERSYQQWSLEGECMVITPYKPDKDNMIHQPEVAWYPEHRWLGVQYHPEWLNAGSGGLSYTYRLITKYLGF